MNNSSKLSKSASLRQKAEMLLRINSSETGSPLSEIENLKLVHELEVHQIELELTNEELLLANSAAQQAAQKYTELFDFAPSGYFTLSKEGTVIDLNFSGAKMLCKKRTDLKNSNFTFFVSNDTKPIFNLFLSKVFNSKTEESCEVILSVNDNLPMYVYMNGIVTENGEQCHVNVMNITDQKLAAELTIANKELAFQNEEKEKRANELIIANKELAFQNEEKEKRAAELTRSKQLLDETGRLARIGGWEIILKNKELSWSDMIYEIHEVEQDYQPTVESAINFYAPEGIPVISEAVRQAIEEGKSYDIDLQLITAKQNRIWVRAIGQAYRVNGEIVKIGGVFQDITSRKQAEQELILANKELAFQNKEKEKRANELIIANKELAFQNKEKEKRANELIIANKELAFQNEEKEKRADELIIVNKELAFQNEEKEKRADELIIANKELAYQNEEKEKRANELIIANKELAYQNEEKEKRANELIIANKELAFQNEEKEKRADELIIANKELAFQNEEKEKRADELIIANKALFQSEENFRRSISESPLGIRIISIEEETIYVNKAFLDIYEFNSLEEYRSIPAINRYTPESYAQHQIRKEKIKNGHDIFDYEVSIVRENAEVRYVKVWRKEVLWNGVKHYQTFNLDITGQKLVEEALNKSQQELRKFATHLQNVREEEKLSLSREIHDDLCQISVALKIDMGLFERKLTKGIEAPILEELLSKLKDFSGQVDNSIKSARRIMNGLRPELIELLGFEEACKSYLHDFEETHHINSQFESTILNLDINLEQSVALFRILQEALNNIIKHAKANLVTVQLSNSVGKLVFQVVDNGVGFDENHNGRQDSYGLIGMKERVFLLDGNLVITSKVGKGTSVRVEIPYIS